MLPRRIPSILVTVSLALCLLTALPAVSQEHGHDAVVVPVDEVVWSPGPPALPSGSQFAVLEGNPHEPGTTTMRLKFPAGYEIPAHWHSVVERVTVLSGELYVGMGDVLDRSKSTALPEGSLVVLPADMHHFAWADDETVIQLNFQGRFDIFYVNPSLDPRKQESPAGDES